MRSRSLVVGLLALSAAAEAGPPAVPTLARAPTIDGDLADLAPALAFRLPSSARGPTAELALRGAFRRDTLYLGVTVKDDALEPRDELTLSLYFPDSGLTSRGVVYRFGPEGLRAPPADVGAEPWAQSLVSAAARRTSTGVTLEVAIPGRALPRFQATKPLLLSVCAEYTDLDGAGATSDAGPTDVPPLSTCESMDMPGGPVRLPDGLRKSLALAPPGDVEGLEARPFGWVGYARLHAPQWARGDTALTPKALSELVAGADAVDPSSVSLPLPTQLPFLDERRLFLVLSGSDPYASSGGCLEARELVLALYLVDGAVAQRVLQWPAANCRMGRAVRLELSSEGVLTIGYTSGAAAHFQWDGLRFERSELG